MNCTNCGQPIKLKFGLWFHEQVTVSGCIATPQPTVKRTTLIPPMFDQEFHIHWSSDDLQWVAVTTKYASLSYLASTPEDALAGLTETLRSEELT